MTATLEGSSEELVEDSLGGLVVDETSWKYQYIGVIVLTNEMSNLLAPCQTGTYTLMLVQSHGDSLATAANADTWINLAALNAFAERMADVVAKYVTNAISVSLINACCTAIAVFLLSVVFGLAPGLALPFGLVTGIFSLIPMFGSLLSLINL